MESPPAEVMNWNPNLDIRPTTLVPAIQLADDKRQLALLKWGLIPSWAKDRKIGNRMINARSETIAEKPSFRAAYKRRRCLILADGYYEWLENEDKSKTKFLYEVDDGSLFAFAGLWEYWDPEGKEMEEEIKEGEVLVPIQSCTIITTSANDLAAAVHDRMPVILDKADYEDWLTGKQVPLVPFDADRMTATPQETTSPKRKGKK